MLNEIYMKPKIHAQHHALVLNTARRGRHEYWKDGYFKLNAILPC